MESPSPNETWQEITSLVDEIADLARSDLPVDRFHSELLRRVVQASQPMMGVLWERQDDGTPRLSHQINASGLAIDPKTTAETVVQTFKGTGSLLRPPHSHAAVGDDHSDYVLLLESIRVEGETIAVVELFQPADQSADGQRGSQQLLSVVCELAGDFHRNRQLRELRDRDVMRTQLDVYVHKLLEQLDVDHVVYTISNDGRSIIGCDRLSVLTCHGKTCKLRSTSGVDTIDRRSGAVALMEKLAANAAAKGSDIWHARQSSSDVGELRLLADRHLEESNAVSLGLVPLTCRQASVPQTSGVLLVECFDSTRSEAEEEQLRERTRWVAEVSSASLQNALQIAELPLLALSRLVLRFRSSFSRWKGIAAGAAIVALIALLLTPVDFDVEARGTLEPEVRDVIYAPTAGIVVAFPALLDDEGKPLSAVDGLEISAGEVIVELRNSTLDYQLTELLGEQTTAEQRLDTSSVTLEALSRSTSPEERSRFDALTVQKLELQITLRSLADQIELLRKEQERLSIKAKIGGQVQTWDVVKQLQSRPVRQGDRLLTIVKTDGPWRLEVHVPDQHIGYVTSAQAEVGENLPVSFLLRAAPEKVFRGQVQHVALATEAPDEYGASVRVKVGLCQDQQLGHLRPGTTVIARIHCGQEALWYVRLHDLIEAVRTRFLF